MKKKDLAKMALTAFMLASSLPASGNAGEAGAQGSGTYLARNCASCGASAGSRTSCGASPANRPSCGASPAPRASCGASPAPRAGCGASAPNGTSSHPYTRSGTQYETYDSMEYYPTDKKAKNYRSTTTEYQYNTDDSSYQGTTTGPGPNGGYPGAPRGTYKTNSSNPSNPSTSYYR